MLDDNAFAAKGLAQKETLAIVAEKASVFDFVQFVFRTIFSGFSSIQHLLG